MSRFMAIWSLLPAAFLVATDWGMADDPPADAKSAVEAVAPGRFAQWTGQLDSNRFAERNEASRQLEQAGKEAFPALTEAALGDSREATLRAIEILRRHSLEGDESSKAGAKQALQKIAASGHAAAARRAKDALTPPKPDAVNAPLGPIIQGWPIGGQQIQLQIQMNAVGGNQQRRIQINNGVRQIEVTETDLKVKITEEPAGGVQLEVTRKKDGKESTEKYSAKSRDELKKKQPEAYRLYDKYAQQPNARIQVRTQPGVPGGVPAVPPQPR